VSRVTPTREDVDELLAFLPLFEAPGRAFVVKWAGGEAVDGETTTVRYPVYADDVLAFIQAASRPCWNDFGYVPRVAHVMLEDDDRVSRASLDEVRSMLTACVRGERFCDGYWDGLLRGGRVTALLRRLAALRPSVGP
jgi:hypothetical protein